jgi:4-oxalocrotonate tautomerase
MPIVQISIIEGRDPAVVKACVKEVARAVHRTLGAPLATIRVVVQEVPAAFWSVGDETKDEIDAAKADATAQVPPPGG